jgi:hypothetical protein
MNFQSISYGFGRVGSNPADDDATLGSNFLPFLDCFWSFCVFRELYPPGISLYSRVGKVFVPLA